MNVKSKLYSPDYFTVKPGSRDQPELRDKMGPQYAWGANIVIDALKYYVTIKLKSDEGSSKSR